jgi:hypothetical protein
MTSPCEKSGKNCARFWPLHRHRLRRPRNPKSDSTLKRMPSPTALRRNFFANESLKSFFPNHSAPWTVDRGCGLWTLAPRL